MKDSDARFRLTQKTILFTFPIIAVVGVTIPLILGQSYLSLLGSYLAIPMFIAPFIYQKISKNPYKMANSGNTFFLMLLILYFLCYSISVYLLTTSIIRPTAYYAIVTIMASCILIQILQYNNLSRERSIIILLQITMLGLNIIYGITLKYFYFIARTDPLAHAWFINSIIKYGYLTDVLEIYKPFPLWHILCSSIYNTLGLSVPVHKIMFFTGGIVFSFLLVSIYIVSLKLFQNKNIALLSSFFACFYSDAIYFGMSSIARSIIMLLEVLLILLLMDSKNPKKTLLAIFLTYTIILYHPASMPFIMLILFIYYLLLKFYKIEVKGEFFKFSYLITAFLLTLIYWIFYAEEVFQNIIETIFYQSSEGISTNTILNFPLYELFNYLQYVPFFFFIIFGVLFILNSKKLYGIAKVFCLSGLIMTSFSFPGPGLLLNKLAAGFQITRFAEYSLLFICIAGAFGLFSIYHKSRKHLRVVAVSLAILMCFLSISNDFTASDNPLAKRPFYTYYLTEMEVVGFNKIAEMAGGYLFSDYVTYRYYRFSPYQQKARMLMVDLKNKVFFKESIYDMIIIREQELSKRPLKLYALKRDKIEEPDAIKIFKEEYCYNDSSLWNVLNTFDKIYDSKGVVAQISK